MPLDVALIRASSLPKATALACLVWCLSSRTENMLSQPRQVSNASRVDTSLTTLLPKSCYMNRINDRRCSHRLISHLPSQSRAVWLDRMQIYTAKPLDKGASPLPSRHGPREMDEHSRFFRYDAGCREAPVHASQRVHNALPYRRWRVKVESPCE